MPSFALKFYIQKEVKNAYWNPKKVYASKPAVNIRLRHQAFQKRKRLYISDQTFKYLSHQLKVVKEKLPVGFSKIKKLTIVPTYYKQEKGIDAQHGKYRSSSNSIEINYKFLYKGYEDKLIKTLIHEISHAYEEEVEHISIREKFLYLAGWHRKGVVFKWQTRRNFLNYRSPDPYEFTNPAEAFATNMEYFLTDPTYKCRRPLLNNYLSVELLHIPFWDEEYPCEEMLDFPMTNGDKIVWWKLDPKRIYEVHYLLADEGSAAMSLFGHSMIRVVMCAPHRSVVNKECLKDIEHHFVLSYRANITDTFINTIKGFFGGYQSQLFVYSMFSVMNEYNRDEFRNLISVPIELNQFQMQDFVRKMQEEIYAYRGRYQFVTQNCATETLDFFKAFIDTMSFRSAFSLSPRGALDIFHEFGMTYKPAQFHKSEEWRTKNGYFFKSQKEEYQKYFDLFKRYTRYKDLEKYLTESTSAERSRTIWHLRHNLGTKEQYTAMYFLEKFIKILRNRNFQNKIIQFAEDKNGAKVLKELVEQKIEAVRQQYPKKRIGYGIPLPAEFEHLRNYTNESHNKVNIDPKLVVEAIKSNFPDDLVDQDQIDANLKELKSIMFSLF